MTEFVSVGYGPATDRHFAVRVLLLVLLTVGIAHSQMPEGFHWVDFKREVSTASNVEQALKAENYTAIREIGVADGFALVLTVRREPGQSTPEGDQWTVYSVSTKNWEVRTLLTGYNLQMKDWIRLQKNAMPEIGILYMDCWECEPASVFTVFHCDPHEGWRARWANKQDSRHPGIPFLYTDVGDPYTNEDVDQVFAVFNSNNGAASVGTWFHARDLSTGKVNETTSQYSVDPSTGKDRFIELTGAAASKWIRQLCKADGSSSSLFGGQSSHGCRRVLGPQRKTQR